MIVNRTILLVEDSDSDRLLFSKYIKQIGYDCDCMDSADKLIARFESFEPSVILMDIEMPGINGLEAATIIRKRQVTNQQKHIIIALTAHNDDNILSIVANAGFDDYLQKPITRREFACPKIVQNPTIAHQTANSIRSKCLMPTILNLYNPLLKCL